MSLKADEFVTLEAKNIVYLSPNDEAAFFEWIDKIGAVRKCEAQGGSLYLTVNNANIDNDSLRELVAIFWRYDVSMKMKQLLVFNREPFSTWFANEDAFWFEAVFGPIPL